MASTVIIDITSRGAGCEVQLTQSVPKEYADSLKQIESGWGMILDHAAKVIGA